MKKITLLLLFLLTSVMGCYAQLFTASECSNLGSTSYGPMYSTATANSNNRTAVIYPASQLAGIAGQTLTAAYFKRSTTTGSMAGTPNFKIYLKETSATDFGASAITWATEIATATLVYDSNPAAAVGAIDGWKNFSFSNNFVYSGTSNLIVYMEYSNTTASTTISWNYEYTAPCVNTANSNTTKYNNNTTGALSATSASTDFRRPFIGFDFLVTCNKPTSVALLNITTTTADVSWTAPATLPQIGYEYYLSTSNVAPTTSTVATGSVVVGTNTVALTGLTSGTQYYVWVRSNCGLTDKSVWTPVSAFKTVCDPVTDFVENFEGWPTGAGNLPICWNKLGTSANVYTTTGSVTPMSPANRLYLNVGTAGLNAFAILPNVSNLSANTHRLKFTAYATAAAKDLDVGYLTNASDPNTFVLIQTILMPSTAAASAQTFTVVPASIPVGVTNLVFRNQPATGTSFIYIDDVKWEVNSTCVEPSALIATSITENSATLGWTGGPETEWTIQYGLQNFALGTGTIVSGVMTNPFLISGLSSNTKYQYYVRAVCTGSINSSWSGPYSFKTLCSAVTTFSENFDASPTGAGNLPDCWSSIGTATTVYTTTGSVAPMSPSNRLYFYAGTGLSAVAVLPTVSNLSAGTHRLRLTAYATAVSKILEVGYLTNPVDASSFVSIQSVPMPSTTAATAQIFVIIPASIPVGVTKLALRNQPATGTSTIYIDDVIWEAIPAGVPACSVVSAPANGSTNQSVATNLSWSSNLNATGYKLSIGTTSAGTDILNNFDLGNVTSYNPPVDFSNSTTYFITLIAYNTTGDAIGCTETSFSTSPATPNDNCLNAVALTVNPDFNCGSSVNGTLLYATDSGVTDNGAGTPNDDVWYSFVATAATHRITLTNVAGTPTDLVHEIMTGTCGTLASVLVSDPNTSNPTGLVVGNTYYVRVFSFTALPGATTTFTICVGTTPPPPSNDDASGAIALTINPDLACAVTTNGTTISATASTDAAPTCSATGINDDVWYSFTATETRHRFVYSGVTTGTMATALYTGTPGSLVELPGACLSGATQTFNGLTAGTVYYARVYTTVATVTTVTNFTVCVGILPPPPVNDDCASAINVSSLPYTSTQDATSASNNSGFIAGCDTGMNDGVWYSFEVGTTGNVTIAVTGVTGWDPEIAVYPTCGAFTCVGFVNAGGSGVAETLNLTALAPGQYRINIGQSSDTVDNMEGPLTINITGTALLGTDSFDNANFSYYPNPVKEVLNLSYNTEISAIRVFNVLGQEVMTKAINASQSQIDMSHLTAGTYIVQVTADDQVKMIKVVKE